MFHSGLSCFVVVLVLTTLLIVCYHRHQVNGKATFGNVVSKLDNDSSKKGLVTVEWREPNNEPSKTNNGVKNLPASKHCIQAHVHNTTRPSPVPVKSHPLEPEVKEHKPLSELPAWDIPPMIDIVLSPDSTSSSIPEDYIEDPDETNVARRYPDWKATIPDQYPPSEIEPDDIKGSAVTWNDIEEYGRKFYKLTRNFLGRDDGRPESSISTTSNTSSVVTVVENPLA